MKIDTTIETEPPALDAEGFAICPDCGSCVHCVANLEKRHRGTKIQKQHHMLMTLRLQSYQEVEDSEESGQSKCNQVPRKGEDHDTHTSMALSMGLNLVKVSIVDLLSLYFYWAW